MAEYLRNLNEASGQGSGAFIDESAGPVGHFESIEPASVAAVGCSSNNTSENVLAHLQHESSDSSGDDDVHSDFDDSSNVPIFEEDISTGSSSDDEVLGSPDLCFLLAHWAVMHRI